MASGRKETLLPKLLISSIGRSMRAWLEPTIKTRLADLGGSVLLGSPADFGKLLVQDAEKWAKVIRAANIKAE